MWNGMVDQRLLDLTWAKAHRVEGKTGLGFVTAVTASYKQACFEQNADTAQFFYIRMRFYTRTVALTWSESVDCVTAMQRGPYAKRFLRIERRLKRRLTMHERGYITSRMKDMMQVDSFLVKQRIRLQNVVRRPHAFPTDMVEV